MSALTWQPHGPPWLIAALAFAAVCWALHLHRRMRQRWGVAGAWRLLAPKLGLIALVVLALLGPSLAVTGISATRTVLVLVDDSGSMDIQDPGRAGTRRTRAENIAAGLKAPAGLTLERRWFDTAVHQQPPSDAPVLADAQHPAADAPAAPAVRGTDLAACLQQAGRAAAAGDCAGMVVLSDGGDEGVSVDDLPGLPIAALGMGTDLRGAPDLALADCDCPGTVERGISFPVRVDASASGPEDFLASAGAVQLTLERLEPGAVEAAAGDQQQGVAIASSTLDLSHGRAHATFHLTENGLGLVRYRVRLDSRPGEVSLLDNQRILTVEVRERSLHVLYVSRSIGLSYKPLRSELARDGGIGFTALFRTIGGRLAQDTGERFTIQGDRLAGDERLGTGLPEDPAVLAAYDCVILGAVPAGSWSVRAQQVLADWVEHGGALIWEGGEAAFGRGGYADSPLALLLPWQISADEPELARANFTLEIPPQAQGHAVVQGLPALLAGGAAIASLNQPGPLRSGAQALIETAGPLGTTAVVAVQSFGKGKVMGIATDTLWRLGEGGGATAYGVFWRQAVRWCADRGEGGQVLRVTWDKSAYRPGDTAHALVRIQSTGGTCTLSAGCDGPDGHSDLPATPAPEAGETAWSLAVPLHQRGDYHLRLVAYREAAALEAYQKVLLVAPALPEGARPARDEEGLRRLAAAHGGIYAGEEDSEAQSMLGNWLAGLAHAPAPVQSRSLVFNSPWWLLLVAMTLLTEWIIRRRRNLV